MTDFLPITRTDAEKRGWNSLDFVLITGDAYVDHPSFGAALIGRLLESRGYRVGILSQPDWRDSASFRTLGRPRLGFLITSGNVDSMVNHYSAARHLRKNDAYSPGGKTGLRPNRALLVYASCAKQAYKKTPVILGGLEASLRRFSHYDYWSDKVRRSVLVDSKADLLVYGMGERAVLEIAERLAAGEDAGSITSVRGTSYRCSLEARQALTTDDVVELPSFDAVKLDRRAYAAAFTLAYQNIDPFTAKTVVEPYDNQYLVQNPPSLPLSTAELDELYELPYTRNAHPVYNERNGAPCHVPAEEEVKFSLVSSRGCFGGCSFCSLTFHQGRIVQSRSHESLFREAKTLVRHPEFKGYIHDVGGPTANFRQPACGKQLTAGACTDKQCMYPDLCSNLTVDHGDYLDLLRKLRALEGVKKVFVRSGIRFDYLMADNDDTFFRELCEHHISGQLKVAPEHVSEKVLAFMGKPSGKWYDAFTRKYKRINRELGKKQYLVPYFISSHPGSTLEDAVELAEYLRDSGFIPQQVQDFYPTPGTLATCMYHTEIDPRTGNRVYVARGLHDKAMQRALIQYRNPANYKLVKEALSRTGRKDLIGFDKKSLLRPEKAKRRKNTSR